VSELPSQRPENAGRDDCADRPGDGKTDAKPFIRRMSRSRRTGEASPTEDAAADNAANDQPEPFEIAIPALPIPSITGDGRSRSWQKPAAITALAALVVLNVLIWRHDSKRTAAKKPLAHAARKVAGASQQQRANSPGELLEPGPAGSVPRGMDGPLESSAMAEDDGQWAHTPWNNFLQAPLAIGHPEPGTDAQHRSERKLDLSPFSSPNGRHDWLLRADAPMEGKLDGRKPGGRSEGVRYRGGTAGTEQAVEDGIRWLVAHQRNDGSWHFDHTNDACMHYCGNPGTETSTTAATALALLPFLGAGYTQLDGEYQDVVKRGLYYLLKHNFVISYGTDLRDGSMYGQALATIALCEAYGMTHDEDLKQTAQGGIKFIVDAQDPHGGGWRYTPGVPGDTTVTGWMLMALKSGQMAHLEVPSPTIFAIERFLASVESEHGAQYGYMSRAPGRTTTAVGLLCRMYTGWRRDNPAIYAGVSHVREWGLSLDNIYYNYYATQLMYHFGGGDWDDWNRKMRDHLVRNQSHAGHSSGSWYFSGGYGKRGGRLYNTAMAIMILEVYYRYMPLYTEASVEREF
jgi:hypothetical protein